MAEWIDFPRGPQSLPNGSVIPGNNYSFDKCRRRFDLVSLSVLLYSFNVSGFATYFLVNLALERSIMFYIS